VASTLLAVDDSLTMRKVLEITFAGPEFRVITANNPDVALQKLKSDKPDLVIADVTLEPNGYDLCKAIKKASPGTPVIILSSKQNAFDAAKGSACQADDHMDKPFDTQQMIDKVKKLLPGMAAAKAQVPQKTDVVPSPPAAAAPVSQPAAAAARPATAVVSSTPQRAKTLIYNPPAAGGAPLVRPTTTTSGVSPSAPSKVAPVQAETTKQVPAVAPAAVTAHVNGQMASKLEQLGLTPAQVDAVLALSRDVVERVVWEVVPVLAETLIKEELARLTR
jgi:DNA-binding response OmpR family regulator